MEYGPVDALLLASVLQNCEGVNVFCFSHPVWSVLLQAALKTNTDFVSSLIQEEKKQLY